MSSVEMIVTHRFVHQGDLVFPGDLIVSPESEAVYLRLANLAEPSTGSPSPDVEQIDAANWLVGYAKQIVELEHKFLVVKGFLK